MHISTNSPITFEVTPKRIYDKGGGLVKINGRIQLIEGMALPKEEIEYELEYYNTLTHWISIDSLLDFFGIDISRINYVNSNKTPFSKSIYKMDLMVCNVSNCFFEAQAAGVPTIFFEPHFNKKALLPPFNGTCGEEVLRVSTGEELLQLILSNQNNPKYLNNFLDNFLEKHAPLYMGNLDGMASKRIIEFVCNKKESLTDLL